MPQFSIIIPVYNAANTLAETLASVAKQSFSDFEVVLVDDGSTDNSAEISVRETKDWVNVTVLSQANQGLGCARNVAAKIAKGHWLVFLDGDDYWAPNKLHFLNEAITEDEKTEFLYHPVFEKYASGKMRQRTFWEVNSIPDFVAMGNPFVPSAVAIKREVFLAAGGFIEVRNQVEDLLLWFKLLAKGTTFQALHRPLTVYRVGAGVTANLQDHMQKVAVAISAARQQNLISEAGEVVFMQRKNYEAARQLHKLGEFALALEFYKSLKATSIKAKVLAALCRQRISL